MSTSKYSALTIFSAQDKITPMLGGIKSRVDGFAKGIAGSLGPIKPGIGAIGRGITNLGTVATGAAVATGGLLGHQVITAGMEFEQTLANIRAVAKPTTEELAAMGDTALKVGADMGFSGSEVASAMEAMSKQGLSVKDVIGGISGVAAAAAADGATLEDTMGGLLSTMTGMGLGADQLQHIADVMARAGDLTAAGIGSLSQSMAVFGPTAKAYGISIEDSIGQLAILQDAGIDAASAGTTLAAVYSKLGRGTGSTETALKTLGISVKDSFGNMKEPAALMNELLGSIDKIEGNVGKAAAVTELVGLESQKALLNLVAAAKSGKLEGVMSSLTKGVDGYAKEVAAIKMDSTAGDFKRLASSVEAVKIQLFGLLSGPLRAVAQGIQAIVSQRADGIVAGVGRLIERVTPLVKLFSDSFLGTVGAIGEGLSMLFPPTDDGKEWNVLLTGFAKNLGQLAGVAAAVVAGVAGVTAAIVAIGSVAFSTLKGALDGVVAFFGERVFALTDWFANLGAMFDAEGRGFFEKAWNIGKQIVTGLVQGIKSIAMAPFDLMQSIGKSALAGLKGALGIASPSKEMAELGRFSAAGFTDGLLSGVPAVHDAFSNVIRLPSPAWSGGPDSGGAVAAPWFAGGQAGFVPDFQPRVVSRAESQHIMAEITIRDETGKARITEAPKSKARVKLNLLPGTGTP